MGQRAVGCSADSQMGLFTRFWQRRAAGPGWRALHKYYFEGGGEVIGRTESMAGQRRRAKNAGGDGGARGQVEGQSRAS